MKKQQKNTTNNEPKVPTSGIPVHGAWGVALLFVVASIAFSTYMVYFGTDDVISKALLVPQALFAAAFLLIKAAK